MKDSTSHRTSYGLLIQFSAFLVVVASSGCGKAQQLQKEHEILASPAHLKVVSTKGKSFLDEGLVFIPVHSDLRNDDSSIPLTINLTIHNADFEEPIVVTSVRCFAHTCEMVKEYLSEHHSLEPMRSAEFVMRPIRPRSESALNFIVEWNARIVFCHDRTLLAQIHTEVIFTRSFCFEILM